MEKGANLTWGNGSVLGQFPTRWTTSTRWLGYSASARRLASVSEFARTSVVRLPDPEPGFGDNRILYVYMLTVLHLFR